MLVRSRLRAPLLLASSLALLLGLADSASAQEQFHAGTWNKPSASLGLRFATDNLNVGLGLHGGYTINPGIYLGGLFDYFFGESDEVFGAEYSFSAWMLMFEGGYDFGLVEGKLVLRPVLLLGVLGVTGEACVGNTCMDDSDTDFEGGLGGHVIYLIDSFSLGGEMRLIFGDADAFVIGVNGGMVF